MDEEARRRIIAAQERVAIEDVFVFDRYAAVREGIEPVEEDGEIVFMTRFKVVPPPGETFPLEALRFVPDEDVPMADQVIPTLAQMVVWIKQIEAEDKAAADGNEGDMPPGLWLV